MWSTGIHSEFSEVSISCMDTVSEPKADSAAKDTSVLLGARYNYALGPSTTWFSNPSFAVTVLGTGHGCALECGAYTFLEKPINSPRFSDKRAKRKEGYFLVLAQRKPTYMKLRLPGRLP